MMLFFFFFFQAEDGIRDDLVTGVQTCALPISGMPGAQMGAVSIGDIFGKLGGRSKTRRLTVESSHEIGRASCRGRGSVFTAPCLVETIVPSISGSRSRCKHSRETSPLARPARA